MTQQPLLLEIYAQQHIDMLLAEAAHERLISTLRTGGSRKSWPLMAIPERWLRYVEVMVAKLKVFTGTQPTASCVSVEEQRA